MQTLFKNQLDSVLSRRREHLAKGGFTPKAVEIVRDGDTAELLIYGAIGESFWEDSVSAIEVVKALNEHKDAEELKVRVNSQGGDVFDGVAIYNALVEHPAHVTVQVDGLAASAASLIAMAGDIIRMGTGTRMMVHRSWTYAIGNESDLEDVADILRKIDGALVGVYSERTNNSVEDVTAWVEAETYFTPAQALDAGFADEIAENVPVPADPQDFDLTKVSCLRVAAMAELQEDWGPSPEDATEDEDSDDVVFVDDTPEAPTAATVEELAAIGKDADWIVAQLKANATIQEAMASWTEHLEEALAEQGNELLAAQKKIELLEESASNPVSFDDDNDEPPKRQGGLKIRMPGRPSNN